MCFSCSCLKMNIASEHPLFFRNPNWFSLSCGSVIYIILFSSILANTLHGCDTESILFCLLSVSIYVLLWTVSTPSVLFHLSRLLCILSTAVLHRLLLLLLLSRWLFRLFRVSFLSLLISVTPRLLIVVFLARAPECLVPKSCCLSCPHLDLVTLQSNLPISV